MPKKIFAPILILFLSIFLVIPIASKALVFETGESVSLKKDVNGNFFAAGNMVTIDSVINGDLFAAGNSISITGTINGDVFAVGSNIDVSGEINGNLRLLGSNINLRGRVERNILAASANLSINESAYIGGHITYSGGELNLNAPLGGNIDGIISTVRINDIVGGDMDINLGAGKLSFTPRALVKGSLNYTAVGEAEIQEGAQILGGINYRPWDSSKAIPDKERVFGFITMGYFMGKFVKLLGMFFIGLLILYIAPKPLKKMNDLMLKKPGACVGNGLVVFLFTPTIALLLAVTIIGLPLAFIAMALYGIALCFSKPIIGIVIGDMLIKKLKLKIGPIWSMFIGVFLLLIVMSIPFIGWIAGFIAILWALGAGYQVDRSMMKDWK